MRNIKKNKVLTISIPVLTNQWDLNSHLQFFFFLRGFVAMKHPSVNSEVSRESMEIQKGNRPEVIGN